MIELLNTAYSSSSDVRRFPMVSLIDADDMHFFPKRSQENKKGRKEGRKKGRKEGWGHTL